MRKLTVVLAAGLVFGASGMAMAVDDHTATATTTAVVVVPINLTNAGNLHFGRLASAAAETISIAADTGTRASTGTLDLVAQGPTPTRAVFTVGGEPNLTYSISAPAATIILTSGSDTLTATLTGVYVLSTATQTAANTAGSGTLSALGADTLGIGGSIPITATTVSGTYANAAGISLTVAYN